MIVEQINELLIYGVYGRGVPNTEYIAIQCRGTINMGSYGLMIGYRTENASAVPIRDNLLWFGDAIVAKGDWIFVFTGPGESRNSKIDNSDNRIYSVHWGKENTIFANQNIVPILFRLDGVDIKPDPVDLPQKILDS